MVKTMRNSKLSVKFTSNYGEDNEEFQTICKVSNYGEDWGIPNDL